MSNELVLLAVRSHHIAHSPGNPTWPTHDPIISVCNIDCTLLLENANTSICKDTIPWETSLVSLIWRTLTGSEALLLLFAFDCTGTQYLALLSMGLRKNHSICIAYFKLIRMSMNAVLADCPNFQRPRDGWRRVASFFSCSHCKFT